MQTDLMSKQVVDIINTGFIILMIRVHRLHAPHSSSSGGLFFSILSFLCLASSKDYCIYSVDSSSSLFGLVAGVFLLRRKEQNYINTKQIKKRFPSYSNISFPFSC